MMTYEEMDIALMKLDGAYVEKAKNGTFTFCHPPSRYNHGFKTEAEARVAWLSTHRYRERLEDIKRLISDTFHSNTEMRRFLKYLERELGILHTPTSLPYNGDDLLKILFVRPEDLCVALLKAKKFG